MSNVSEVEVEVSELDFRLLPHATDRDHPQAWHEHYDDAATTSEDRMEVWNTKGISIILYIPSPS